MVKDRKSECLEDLRMRILTLDAAPGSDLDEASLCKEYGLSRTPMREIFQRLSGEGYIQLAQNRGAKVASMDLPVMRMFFQTAPVVYANVARLAAENRREAEIPALQLIQNEFRMAAESAASGQAALLNHSFHLRIGEMAQNPYLLPSLKRMLIDHTRLSQTFYRPSSKDEADRVRLAIEQHDAMIEAFAARDTDRAVKLTIDHWNLSRDRLEQFVTPDPLPIDVLSEKDKASAI
ncbi:MAG: GntR family transcriptional regulator [Pseudomonadota bacterium]